jgi:uncharacterized protein (DUF934 family)
MSKLIRNNAVVEDGWTVVQLPAPAEEAVRKQAGKVVIFKLTGEEAATPAQIEGATVPATGRVIVPLAVWQARKETLAPRLTAGELGIWLETFELVEDLVASVDDINTVPVIGVSFPRFADGRGFTIATMLRTRYGYKNEIRAIDDVLRDQLYYMKRCGFDAFAIRADRSAEEALASLRDFSEPYQGAIDNPLPVWRRHTRMGAHAASTHHAHASHEDEVD